MRKFLLSGSIVWFFISQGNAQDFASPDTTIRVSHLSEIVVAANRWEQSLREVTGKVSVIGQDQVGFQNPQTAADLLTLSGDVFVQKSQLGGGSPMIRGFATNRVLIVVDGVRMNNAIFRSGNVQNVISLDAHAIQDAEVVFGPGSVIYGSDAIGGVMDFHTLKPQRSNDGKTLIKGNALTRYSSANEERTGHLDISIGLKRWAFVTSVSRSLYDDLKMGSHGPEEYTRPNYVIRQENDDVIVENKDINRQVASGYDQWNIMQKVHFQPAPEWNATYAFHYSKTSDYPRYDRLILGEAGQLANAEWYYGPQKWIMHSLNAQYVKSSAIADQVNLVLAYQDYEESRHNRGFGSSRRTSRTENVKAFSLNLDLDKKLSDRVNLFYGGELVTNTVNSVAFRKNIVSSETEPTSTRYPDGSVWRTYAGYLSLKFRLNEQWLLNASGRYTHVYTFAEFDRAFFDFPFSSATLRNGSLNGSVGAVFSPTRSWKLYANLSSGFRAPNVDDIGKVFDSEPGNVVVPNPGLKPERAYNAEIGTTGYIRDHVKLDLAGYYTIIDNAIVRGKSTFNNLDSIEYDGTLSRVLALQNTGEVWVAGVQARIDVNFLQDFNFKSTFNYQHGKETDPETGEKFSPTHVAPMFGASHLVYTKGKLKADLHVIYNGEISYQNLALSERADHHLYAKDENGNPYAPSWWTLNFKTTCKLNEWLTVDIGVENILDKRYRPYSSGISAPGRNFIVSLRANF